MYYDPPGDSDEIDKRLTAFPIIDDARLTFLI